MSRHAGLYRDGGTVRGDHVGFDADIPAAGHYRMRLRSGAAYVGVRIWHGPPHDPETGEEMDRPHRWQAHVNGSYRELDRVWPKCAGDAITEDEYHHLIRVQQWAEQHAPGSGLDDPIRRIDPLSSPLVF